MNKGFKITLLKNKYHILWYLSIVLFLLYILFIGWYNTTTSNTASMFQIMLIFAIVAIGGIFFSLYESKSKKRLLILIELIVVTVVSVGLSMAIYSFIPTIKVASTQQVLSTGDKVLTGTPTSIPTTLPTIKPTNNAQKVTQGAQIECWGPDGKSFMTTQKECNKFNTAWGKNNNTNSIVAPSQQQNSQPSFNSAAWDLCAANVKNTVLKPCIESCGDKFMEDEDICYWAYGDSGASIEYNRDKYTECSNEVTNIYTSCNNNCTNVILPQELTKQCS